jgi:hypothetical protein
MEQEAAEMEEGERRRDVVVTAMVLLLLLLRLYCCKDHWVRFAEAETRIKPKKKKQITTPESTHTTECLSLSLRGFLDLQCLCLSLAPFFFPLSVRALWLGIRLGLTSRMRPRKIECGDCFGTEDDDEDDDGSRTMYLIRFLLPNLVPHHLLLLLLLLLLLTPCLFHSTHTPAEEEEEEQKPKENYQTIATEKQEQEDLKASERASITSPYYYCLTPKGLRRSAA